MAKPQKIAELSNNILNNTSIKYDYVLSLKEGEDLFNSNVVVGYGEDELISARVGVVPWAIKVNVPQAHDDNFLFDWNEALKADASSFDLGDIDYNKYFKALLEKDDTFNGLKKNTEEYNEVVFEFLEGKVEKLGKENITITPNGVEKKIKVTKYRVKIDMDDILEFNSDLLKVAEDDDDLKEFVIDRLEKIKDIAIDEKDYKHFDIAKSEFKEGFSEAIDDVVAMIDDEDRDDMDLVELMDDYQKKNKLRDEITTNLVSRVVGGEAFVAFISDLKNEANDLDRYDKEEILGAISNFENYSFNLLKNLVREVR